MDLQSEAMVMARKKLKGSDAGDMTYRTKRALPAALIELTLLSCELWSLLHLLFCSFCKSGHWKMDVADLPTAFGSVTT